MISSKDVKRLRLQKLITSIGSSVLLGVCVFSAFRFGFNVFLLFWCLSVVASFIWFRQDKSFEKKLGGC